MQIKSITIYRVKIPFKHPFKHASANRTYAENIIVRCDDTSGYTGWGETIPRQYVTGETIEGTLGVYKNIPRSFIKNDIKDVNDLERCLTVLGFDSYNVAKCGLEMALLDLLARHAGKPLYKYLSSAIPTARVCMRAPLYYGGAIGLAKPAKTILNAIKMRLYHFRTVKLKLENDVGKDMRRLALVRLITGGKMDIRIDANEAWDMEYASKIVPFLKKKAVSAIEQPFPKDKRMLNKQLRDKFGVKIILDESLCTLQDARDAIEHSLADLFCVKLPKVGGFYNALKIFEIAQKHSIGIQLSCQVGESAILSAAGRHLAVLCPTLRYLEGSFDRYLLRSNIVTDDISFGFGGKAGLLEEPGLGIHIDTKKLENLCVSKTKLF